MNDLIKQGIDAYQSGDFETARKVLSEAVTKFPENERAWGYLYNVCTEDQDRIYCLKQMIKINPGNQKTRSALLKHGIEPQPISPSESEQETPVAPIENQSSQTDDTSFDFLAMLRGESPTDFSENIPSQDHPPSSVSPFGNQIEPSSEVSFDFSSLSESEENPVSWGNNRQVQNEQNNPVLAQDNEQEEPDPILSEIIAQLKAETPVYPAESLSDQPESQFSSIPAFDSEDEDFEIFDSEPVSTDDDADPLLATQFLRDSFQKEGSEDESTYLSDSSDYAKPIIEKENAIWWPLLIALAMLTVIIILFLGWLIRLGQAGQGPLAGLATATPTNTPGPTSTPLPTDAFTPTYTPTNTKIPKATFTLIPAILPTITYTETLQPVLTPTQTPKKFFFVTKTPFVTRTPHETRWPTVTPSITNTSLPTLGPGWHTVSSPTVSKATTEPGKTATPAPIFLPSSTPGTSPTPDIHATQETLTLSFSELCKAMSMLSQADQLKWNQNHPFPLVGPWRGKTVNYFSGNSILIQVDGNAKYPSGSNIYFTSPKLAYTLKKTYDLFGTLLSFDSNGTYCLAIIKADERESKNTLVGP